MHEHAALIFLTGGSATVEQQGRHLLEAGDVLLVPAGEPHRVVSSENRSGWGIGVCPSCFSATELAPLLDPFQRARSGASAVVRIPVRRRRHLAALIAELHRETSGAEASTHGVLVQHSLLALVLAEVARASSVSPATELQPGLVGDALRYIESHCLGPLSLADVSAAVHRSPTYVTRTLKHATGKSVGEWVIAGRMSEARRRLLHTDERVDIVADRVGYADVTHFIRLFRRAHGQTPAAWRAERRRGHAGSR